MKIRDITESAATTLANALSKMKNGYLHGRQTGLDTCYAYAGEKLAEFNPPEATIRLWGLKSKNLIVHGDAVLPNGQVYSNIDPSLYTKRGYELVTTMSFSDFKQQLANF
jgi:UDP-2,3-diacylglucosamine pyrophosphatase LpxH